MAIRTIKWKKKVSLSLIDLWSNVLSNLKGIINAASQRKNTMLRIRSDSHHFVGSGSASKACQNGFRYETGSKTGSGLVVDFIGTVVQY